MQAGTGVAPSILQTAEMGEPKYLIYITNLLQNTHQLIIKYLFIILHFCKGDAERVRCVCVCVCVCVLCVYSAAVFVLMLMNMCWMLIVYGSN